MWTKRQAKTFATQASEPFGAGWDLIGPVFQRALLAQRALEVVRGQAADSVPVDAVNVLYTDMLHASGLEDE